MKERSLRGMRVREKETKDGPRSERGRVTTMGTGQEFMEGLRRRFNRVGDYGWGLRRPRFENEL